MQTTNENLGPRLPEIFSTGKGIFMEYETSPLIRDKSGIYSPKSIDAKKKDSFIEKAETLLTTGEDPVDKPCLKRSINSAIELIENMHRYRLPTEIISSAPEGASIEKDDEFVTLSTHNIINQKGKEKLARIFATIDEIFDREDDPIQTLKDISLSTLQNDSFNTQGGAGKGFMETARKNKTNFEYSFTPLEEGLYEFKISTFIPRKKKEAQEAFKKTKETTAQKVSKITK